MSDTAAETSRLSAPTRPSTLSAMSTPVRRASGKLKFIPRRYMVAFLAFLGFCNVYMLRVDLSVAIVAMVADGKTNVVPSGTPGSRKFELPMDKSKMGMNDFPGELKFQWSAPTRGLILSSFFYGYVWTQLPGGWLANRWHGHALFGGGIAATAILTIITPPVALKCGTAGIVTLRILEGLFEGVTYPSIHAVWAKWAPVWERSRLATAAFSGSYVGTIIGMALAGPIASSSFGWPAIFYFYGVVALLWWILWVLFVKESPEKDEKMSTEELALYKQGESLLEEEDEVLLDSSKVIPWKSMLTSMPVWAIVCAHFAENWGFYTLLTELPSFMQDVYHFDLAEVGMISALPYVAMAFMLPVGGCLADWLRNPKRGTWCNTTRVRKAFTCAAFLAQAFFLLLTTTMVSSAGAIACLTMAVGCGGLAWAGFSVNHLDLAPQYASILMGMSNTVATIPGILAPLVTGLIVKNQTWQEWRYVFFLSAGIYVIGAILYCAMASGEIQVWACHSHDQPAGAGKGGDESGINPNYCENADDEELVQDRGKQRASGDVAGPGPGDSLAASAEAGQKYGTVGK